MVVIIDRFLALAPLPVWFNIVEFCHNIAGGVLGTHDLSSVKVSFILKQPDSPSFCDRLSSIPVSSPQYSTVIERSHHREHFLPSPDFLLSVIPPGQSACPRILGLGRLFRLRYDQAFSSPLSITH